MFLTVADSIRITSLKLNYNPDLSPFFIQPYKLYKTSQLEVLTIQREGQRDGQRDTHQKNTIKCKYNLNFIKLSGKAMALHPIKITLNVGLSIWRHYYLDTLRIR